MKPGQALIAALLVSIWALAIIIGYFVLGIVFALAWPYWAFGWMLALILLMTPTSIYSAVVAPEHRAASRRGAMRSLRNAERG